MRITNLGLIVMVVLAGGMVYGESPTWEFSLDPGYAKPVGPTADTLGGSASLDAAAQYNFNSFFSAGLELGYIFGSSNFKGTTPIDRYDNGVLTGVGTVNFTSDIGVTVLHITPEFKAGLPMEWHDIQWKPYVEAGGGYYWTHYTSGNVTLGTDSFGDNFNGRELPGSDFGLSAKDQNNGGFNLGGGVDFDINRNFALGVDVRYHNIVYQHASDNQFVIPSLKATYHF